MPDPIYEQIKEKAEEEDISLTAALNGIVNESN